MESPINPFPYPQQQSSRRPGWDRTRRGENLVLAPPQGPVPARGCPVPARGGLSPGAALTPPCRSEEPVPVPSPVQPGTKRRRELDSDDEAAGSSGGFSGGCGGSAPAVHPPGRGAQPPPHPQVQNRPPQPRAPRRMRPKSRSPQGGGNVSGAWRRKRRRIERLSLGSLLGFCGFKAGFKGAVEAGGSQPSRLPWWFYPKLLSSFSFFFFSDTF